MLWNLFSWDEAEKRASSFFFLDFAMNSHKLLRSLYTLRLSKEDESLKAMHYKNTEGSKRRKEGACEQKEIHWKEVETN